LRHDATGRNFETSAPVMNEDKPPAVMEIVCAAGAVPPTVPVVELTQPGMNEYTASIVVAPAAKPDPLTARGKVSVVRMR
jgi:hypothetical protein